MPFSENTETWAAAAAATGSVTVSEVTAWTLEPELGVRSGAGGASDDPLFTPDQSVEIINRQTIKHFRKYQKYFSLMETDAPDHPGSLGLEAWCKSDLVRDSLYLERESFIITLLSLLVSYPALQVCSSVTCWTFCC